MRKIFFIVVLMLWSTSLFAADKLFLLQDACVRCHLLCGERSKENSVIAWKKGVHFRPDSGCSDCHGGDRLYYMDFQPGHMGIPDRSQTVPMCEKCHQPEVRDFVNRRRPGAGIKMCTVSCADCHGYHLVNNADGGLINDTTCGGCHSPDKAIIIISAMKTAESRMAAIEGKIDHYEKNGFPVTTLKRELEEVRRQYARSFHNQEISRLEGHITEKTMDSLENLEREMKKSNPSKWRIQGVMVLSFLAAVLAVLVFYQQTSRKRK